MISNISSTSQSFLNDLSRLQLRTNTAQQQISSGFRVENASDAPDQIGQLLQLEAELAGNAQAGANLANVKAEVDTGENAVGNAVQLLDQAGTLAAQGASSSATAATRTALAAQVQSIQEQLVRVTGTTAQGRFIFGGDQDAAVPYRLNLANPNGVDRLTTTTATRRIQDAGGDTFAVAQTAQDIFDHRNPDDSFAPDNVFAALNSLRVALAGNDTPGIATAITALHTSAASVNSRLSSYGLVQNRVAAAQDDQQSRATALKGQISAIRDADLTAAILELTSSNTQQQAALAGEAKVSKNSLFSYLG